VTALEILAQIATSSTRPSVANKAHLLLKSLQQQASPPRGGGKKARGGMGDKVIIAVQRVAE
jgi:hypothetical protein